MLKKFKSIPRFLRNRQSGFALPIAILIVVILIIAGGAGYYFYITSQEQKEGEIAGPEQVIDETAGWKTYTNTKHGYQLKVPNDFYNRAKPSSWIGESDDNSLSFEKGDLWYIEITYMPDALFYNPPSNTNLISWLKEWNLLPNEYQNLKEPNFEIDGTPAVKFYSPGMPQAYDVDIIFWIKGNKLFKLQLLVGTKDSKELSYQILSTFKFIEKKDEIIQVSVSLDMKSFDLKNKTFEGWARQEEERVRVKIITTDSTVFYRTSEPNWEKEYFTFSELYSKAVSTWPFTVRGIFEEEEGIIKANEVFIIAQ